ncbi:mono-functional DNA-alkylating methyl methanesulfonate N-term-domain-containing protein [Syncephalis pseudoplumigaleata]|uniref:Mono-functional DNA-alkylating methyl methanesulfonate N-term-domain-containing protein n=1 Tax=Syncephalis pseudoplumigaleata TaxID=1712513 RepID=A0A4P9Z2D5_9FUNG|nr:mono-functional DNA-alkylating methyl methanesulfonate N-term-domain-containing protein [Syncephalis pseudoplumigaleata]|eukprot:RKP25620.1 mono-functional DNA-alkylating methyl methanesulfonate N-term-domain-containing protein [Syncephalis pseudoplumigaleata]
MAAASPFAAFEADAATDAHQRNDTLNGSYLHVATGIPSPVIRHAVQLQLLPERISSSPNIVLGRETHLELFTMEGAQAHGARLATQHREPIHGTIVRMAALPRWRSIGRATATIDLTMDVDDGEGSAASTMHTADGCPHCPARIDAPATTTDHDAMSIDEPMEMPQSPLPHSLAGYRRWPRAACVKSRDLLVVTSDAGLLSLLAYGPITSADYRRDACTSANSPASSPPSRFYAVQEMYLGRPGLPFDACGHHLCVDPQSRALAVAAWQDQIKVLLLKCDTGTTIGQGGEHATCAHGYPSREHASGPVDLFARQLDITEECSLITGMTFLWPAMTHRKRILLAITYASDRDAMAYLTIYQIMVGSPNEQPSRYARLPLGKGSVHACIHMPLCCMLTDAWPLENCLITHLFAIPTLHEQLIFVTDRRIGCLSAEDARNGNSHLNTVNLPATSAHTMAHSRANEAPAALVTSVAVRIADDYRSAHTVDGMIDDKHVGQGLRIYLGTDCHGLLRLVLRANRSMDVHAISLDQPAVIGGGSASVGEALLCLRAGTSGDVLLISGEMCDGQLVMVSNAMQVKKLHTKQNWAPLVDFTMCDAFNDRQKTIYACCGAGAQGTLREIRHGLLMAIQVWSDADFDGLNGMWNLPHETMPDRDRYLILSYMTDTRVFSLTCGRSYVRDGVRAISPCSADAIQPDGGYEMEDLSESSGFRLDTRTLLACSYGQGHYWLQVYPGGVRIASRRRPAEHAPSLSHEPTAVHVLRCKHAMWGAVATRLPAVYLLRKTSTDISIRYTLALDNIGMEGLNLAESLCYFHNAAEHQGLLLAGLRDGNLMSWRIEEDEEDEEEALKCTPLKPRMIGSLPVKLKPWSISYGNSVKEMALVLSDRPWRIHMNASNSLELNNILYTRSDIITEATAFQYGNQEHGLVFTVKAQLGMAMVGRRRRAIVRRVTTIHTSGSKWTIAKGSHTYRYICVGTDIGGTSSQQQQAQQQQQQQGRLLIYSLKRAPSTSANESCRFELKTVWIAELPRPVYRICPIKESYLLVAAGKTLYVYQLNMEQRKLVKVCKEDMRFPITKLATHDHYFTVGCQRASFSLFMLDIAQSRIVFVQSDRQPRMPIECAMGAHCMVGTDQSGHIVGLMRNPHTLEETLTTVFSMKQPDIIGRLLPGLPFHRALDDASTIELDWPIASTGPLIGASMLGAFYVLRRIDAQSLGGRLLEQLQHIMEVHPITRPVLGHLLDQSSSALTAHHHHHHHHRHHHGLHGDFLDQYLSLALTDQYELLDRLKERITWMLSSSHLPVESTMQTVRTMPNHLLHQWLCHNLTLLRP